MPYLPSWHYPGRLDPRGCPRYASDCFNGDIAAVISSYPGGP